MNEHDMTKKMLQLIREATIPEFGPENQTENPQPTTKSRRIHTSISPSVLNLPVLQFKSNMTNSLIKLNTTIFLL